MSYGTKGPGFFTRQKVVEFFDVDRELSPSDNGKTLVAGVRARLRVPTVPVGWVNFQVEVVAQGYAGCEIRNLDGTAVLLAIPKDGHTHLYVTTTRKSANSPTEYAWGITSPAGGGGASQEDWITISNYGTIPGSGNAKININTTGSSGGPPVYVTIGGPTDTNTAGITKEIRNTGIVPAYIRGAFAETINGTDGVILYPGEGCMLVYNYGYWEEW